MPKSQSGCFQISVAASSARRQMARVGILCAVGFASILFVGCGELEPMHEPEVVDLQLTTDTLKTSVRDAQRMVAELRADLELRRRELAEAQVARAQLEGRVREAERRVVEARQVIELQREELAVARTERERVFRSSRQSQSQVKPRQRPMSKAEESGLPLGGQEVAPLSSSGAMRKGQKAFQTPVQHDQSSEFRKRAVASDPVMQVSANRESSAIEHQGMLTRSVSVKPGDTLWRIAKKYRVDVEQLRTINQLTDNRIVIGQALWLPVDRPMSVVGADTFATAP